MSNLKQVIEESFTQYSGAVLQSRALVDVRDCLKPSARQIFYCLYTDKFLPSKPFKKTLKAIGSAARMYIHGDASCEGVIMRAGQPFAMRYPLIEVEGNEGNLMSSGNWAAPRYTASRLSEFSVRLFNDIDKNTIKEWRDNYDDTEQYPSVLPTKGFYNIVNGTMGIGIGAASSIPQFNIKEVNHALEVLLLNPDATFDDIYCAPDFATGAILLNEKEVKEALKTGQGSACKLRSVVEWDSSERSFIVSQIPYSVYTNTICEELEAILNDDLNNPGIERFNDLTGVDPLIKIYLTKKANPDRVLKYLYKNTSLQSHFGINMTMLDDGRYPKVFGWKAALQAHIDHEKIVYRRGFEFDLAKIEKRIHILDGLLICIANIDEVVKVIKTSTSTAAASSELQKRFLLDGEQAKAVLDMKLSRLASLEVKKLENEKEKLQIEAARIHAILESEELFNQELINGWREIAQKFGDARRTQILNIENESDEPTEKKQLSLSFTNKGAVFVTETSSLYSQRRNGIGTKLKLEKDEILVDNIIGENTETILFFTNKGNYYHMKMGEFIIGEKQYLSNYFSVGDNEALTAAVGVNPNNAAKNIVFVTKNGLIKKSKLSEYNMKRNVGALAIKLDSNDEIVSILILEDEKIGIMSKSGQFIMVATSSIKAIGRVTRGIIGMKLAAGDTVVAARAIPVNTTQLFSISIDGYGKNTSISEFNVTGTNTKGVKIQKAESMCDFIPVVSQSDILINSNTTQIRIKYSDIPNLSRGAQGTKLIKLTNNYVIGISSL
jgi:DNA gyrase subunit A